jgi:gluconate 5-dehydrogenase
MPSPTIQELFNLTGQVAVVTGGARNLGFDMATALAEAGADVAICSRTLDSAQKSAKSLAQDTGRRAIGYACDVREEQQVEKFITDVLADFGKIDILVNNSGNVFQCTEDNHLIENRPLEGWLETVNTNMTGSFLMAKHVVAKAMKPAKQGTIVMIGSVAGMGGKDRRHYTDTGFVGCPIDYEAAKGGVINMTRDLACQLAAYNIRVNCISPGGFERGQPQKFIEQYNLSVPMKRMGQDGKEMKGAVVFLASQASSYVTGINLPVDGGLTAW